MDAGDDERYLFFTYLIDGGIDWKSILEGEELEEYLELKGDEDREDELEEFLNEKETEYWGYVKSGEILKMPELLLTRYGEWIEMYALSDDAIRNWRSPSLNYVALYDYPPCYFMSYEGFVKNDWLVHFSEAVESIAVDGFAYGVRVDDMKGLALSTWKEMDEKKLMDMDGYVFSYELSRAETNLFEVGMPFVIFRGSGIRVYHNGDFEFQVICMKDSVRDIIPVYWVDSGYEIRDKDNERVYWKSGSGYIGDVLEELNDWIGDNIRQYEGRIVTRVKPG